MRLYKTKWWQKMFKKPKPRPKIDAVKDIGAIHDFLEEAAMDVQKLTKLFSKLEELEKERHVAKKGIVHVNLHTQGEVLDKLLQYYTHFQTDVDITMLRLQNIAKEFLNHATHAGMKDYVKEKKKHDRWIF